ncbi:MAG: hypothetical protein ACLQK8_28025 [Streptosporangiaceae bacterium]
MDATRRGRVSGRAALRAAGGGLLLAIGAMHLDLYLTGYRTIPVIGWLFLLQVIAAFGLAALVLATGSRLAAAAGAGLALSTLGGYVLSVAFGLFGFREVRTTAGIAAGITEIAAFAVLAALALIPGPQAARQAGRGGAAARALLASAQRRARGAAGVVAGLSVVAAAALAVALAGAGSPVAASPGSPGAMVTTVRIGSVTVLASTRGLTLYWFAPDTATRSACNGSCAAYWPPVRGPVTAGPGVTGTLGTIRRADGTVQATYDGHPLYTYIGDSARGQASGNDLNLNGGLWHEVTVTG